MSYKKVVILIEFNQLDYTESKVKDVQFLLDYTILIDGLALFALIFLAALAVVQNKSGGLAILALIVSFWALIRLFNLI